ncbi:MAG: putative HTH-type transcriptional regulator [Acidimicrobiales bacterium]|nr:MAG: XRE family transcriptional regulator [Actinomycetota bacterium]MBV6508548.1 putative HTH-type transcriptional regulator [Acidimicrobiales bacterium]RIK05215.1 MAG: XRE family transcriptional regulator [Acidobacteriota bacterium]
MADEGVRKNLEGLGDFIRRQRTQAEMSLRDLAARTNVSNPYLSQIERGLHEPSIRVLKSIAGALNLSAETLLAQAGLLEARSAEAAAAEGTGLAEGAPGGSQTIAAIESDPDLSEEQRQELLERYRAMVARARSGHA